MHASWSRLCASVRAAYWGATPFQTRARLSQHSDLRENEPIPVHFIVSIEMFAGRRLDECHVERQAYRAKFTPRTERAWSGNVIRKIKHLLCKLSHQPLPRVSQRERERLQLYTTSIWRHRSCWTRRSLLTAVHYYNRAEFGRALPARTAI